MTAIDDPLDAVGALTQRQREVLELAARGMTNPEIGERLGISKDGAKWHIGEILARLDVDTREEAVDLWKRYNGLPYRLHRLARAVMPSGLTPWVVVGIGVGAAAVVAISVLAFNLTNGSATPSPSAPSVTASSTVPAGTSTGEGEVAFSSLPLLVQSVAQAVEQGDAAAIRAVLHPKPALCSPPPTPGTTYGQGLGPGPNCPAGAAADTPIGSFVGMGDCEGGYIPPDAAVAQLLDIQKEEPTLRYWVAHGRDGALPGQPVDFLIFGVAKPALRQNNARVIEVDSSGVINIVTGCAATVSEFASETAAYGGVLQRVNGG